MKFNIKDLAHKIYLYYYSNDEYTPYNDPSLTYEEFLMIHEYRYYVSSDTNFDTDSLSDDNLLDKEAFKYYLASLFIKPKIKRTDWENILVDRAHKSKSNIMYDENGKRTSWQDISPFKEINDARNKEDKRIQDKIIEDWEAKKEKQKLYQRKRRAKLKEEKLKQSKTL